MCNQTFHEPHSLVRRSPRLQGSRPQVSTGSQDTTTRRLSFPSVESTGGEAVFSRRIQLHQSVERINVPTSVDPGAGGALSELDCEHQSVREQQTAELQLHANGAPQPVEREASSLNNDFSGEQPLHQQRRVQLQSSVEPVSFPNSVELLRTAPVRKLGGQELSSDEQELRSPVRDQDVNIPRRNSPRGAEILSEDDEHPNLRASHGDDKAGVFTFLCRMSVRELRKLLEGMKLKQQGNKEELVSRILVSADLRLAAGNTFAQIMASHQSTARYESWVQHQRTMDERVPQYWSVSPSLPQLLLKLGNREAEEFRKRKASLLRSREGRDATNEANQQAVNTSRPAARNQPGVSTPVENVCFSINEFARLCIIIRDDEDAKAALLATGQELTRSQMDDGFSRDSFWGVIESRFNDASLRLCLSMVGNVDEVDSTQPPPCHRSASVFKEKFFDARSSFTTCVENWSKSGQNETTNFKSFAGSRSGELTAAGKRNMVLFVCSRLGTENEDTRFRSMCLRTIPYGRGVDEGGSAAPLETESSAHAAERAASRRNSRRNSGADNDSVDQSVVQLSEYVIARGRQREISDEERREERRERRQQRREQREEEKQKEADRREARKRKSADNRGLRQLEENHKLIKLRYTTETLKSQGQDPGTELAVAARRQHEAVFRAFRMPENSLEGLQGDISMSEDYENGIQIAREGRRESNASTEQRRDDDSVRERGTEDDEILPNI